MLIRDALLTLKKPGGVQSQDEELKIGNITLWKDLLESQTTSFQIDQICDSVDRVINETVCSSSFQVQSFPVIVNYIIFCFHI